MPDPAWKVAGCLFSYAMPGFELCEKLAHEPNFSIFTSFRALTEAFVGIAEIGDDRRCPATSAIKCSF